MSLIPFDKQCLTMMQFLDFNRIGEWQSFFKSIEVVEQKSPNGLQPGDQVKVAFSSMSMVAPITVRISTAW